MMTNLRKVPDLETDQNEGGESFIGTISVLINWYSLLKHAYGNLDDTTELYEKDGVSLKLR